jgi:hypothetical protein
LEHCANRSHAARPIEEPAHAELRLVDARESEFAVHDIAYPDRQMAYDAAASLQFDGELMTFIY